jgi:hypothetical protein
MPLDLSHIRIVLWFPGSPRISALAARPEELRYLPLVLVSR